MKIVGACLGFLLVIFSGFVSAVTLDTEGKLKVTCSQMPYMQSHAVYADGRTQITFAGSCYYSAEEDAWNDQYKVSASWNGVEAREQITIPGRNKSGTVVSTCPSNPWLNNVVCQKKSLSGDVFYEYKITATTQYPLTGKALNDSQKAQLRAEVEKKKQEAACVNPVLVSPAVSGSLFHPPAGIKIEVKHNPSNPPKEWKFTWAPIQKQGEWPTAPVAENVALTNLKTVNGVTTGTFNTSKVGNWVISWRVDIPPYCNKGQYAVMSTSFTVKEKSKGEAMSEKVLKDKTHTTPSMKVNTGKPTPDPIDQQKLKQPAATVSPQSTQQKVLQPNLQQQQKIEQEKLQQQQKQQLGQ